VKRLRITSSKGAGIFFYKRFNDDVFVALGKRNESPFRGSWSFAGGNFDKSDVDLFSCAQREAKEEFFYRNSLAFEAIPREVWHASKKITFHLGFFHWHAYFVDVTDVDLVFEKHPREIEDIQWFSINNLPSETLRLVRLELFLAERRSYFINNN
jgi:8-oxo-dGTP pyrophosphatase MutT (NUDIX family)